MIVIHYDRPSGTAWSDAQPALVVRGVDPWFDCCRALVNARVADGPAVFVDDRGVRCMTVRSFHACARRHRRLTRWSGMEQEFGL